MALTVLINGERRQLPEGATVADAVAAVGAPSDGRGVAAAVDGTVIPRSTWESHALSADDRVEVLQAVQGG
jgi:sulfur carrier protein